MQEDGNYNVSMQLILQQMRPLELRCAKFVMSLPLYTIIMYMYMMYSLPPILVLLLLVYV